MLKVLIATFFIYISLYSDENITKDYRWFEGDNLNTKFYILYSTMKKDKTILCKERLELDKLEYFINKYRQNRALKDIIEKFTTTILDRYIQIRNRGCFLPEEFFSENEFLAPKKEVFKNIITNPILEGLQKALERYRQIKKEGGWEKIEAEDTLYFYPGKVYDEIPKIKRRLKIEGYYKEAIDLNKTYDKGLKEAVINFQKHHGIKSDGVIGPNTLDILNLGVDEKIKKILVNIERFRWFLKDDDFFVFVNIPGFFVSLIENNQSIYFSKAVVGRKSRPTPMMRETISYAVINPYWRAPKTIIAKDILPHLKKKEFDIIRRQGIVASLDIYGKKIVNFEDIEWEFFDADNIPFIFLQLPGANNFLGFLKFMFLNRFDVYLHDTNNRGLFNYPYRALSSGCVRVQKPIELYYKLINKKSKEEINYRDIFAIIQSRKNRKIEFNESVPVYLIYLSTFMDKDNLCYFYEDIYGYDKKMVEKIRWKKYE